MATLQSLVSAGKSAGAAAGAVDFPVSPEIGETNVTCVIENVTGGGTFRFPCPKELRSTFGLDYAMTDLALYEYVKDALPSWNPDSGFDAGLDIPSLVEGASVAALKAIPGESIAAGVLRSAGKAINPHSGMVFNSVKPRVFSYTFECVGRSSSDMDKAADIFKKLRPAILPNPTDGKVYWDYPDKFKLYFQGDDLEVLPVTKECHITDLDFNFTGTTGSFSVTTGNKPIIAVLSITLAEIELVNREDVEGDIR